MAADKLTWTELRRALASRAGVSEKEANAFLNAFNEQLVEALKQDKQVKINGLGTFKLQAVAPRKSVNITTGEEITIEGYNKIAFVPEAGVKELVESNGEIGNVNDEKPEAVDPIKKLGAQADEIVDILGELGQSPAKEEPEEAPVIPVTPETPVAPVTQEIPVTPVTPEKPKKKYNFLRDTLICVVILLALLLVGYFFLRHQISSWIDGLVNKNAQTEVVVKNTHTNIVSEEPLIDEMVIDEEIAEEPAVAFEESYLGEPLFDESILDKINTKTIKEETNALLDKKEGIKAWFIETWHKIRDWFYKVTGLTVEEVAIVALDAQEGINTDILTEEIPQIEPVEENEPEETPQTYTPGHYDEFLLTEELTEGSRLAWIAQKYYGDRNLWPYLYDANRDRINDPSRIEVGTMIRVPKLSAAQQDMTSASFQALKEEAYSAIK